VARDSGPFLFLQTHSKVHLTIPRPWARISEICVGAFALKLELENATYQSNLPELLRRHEGKIVLIYRNEVVDVFNHPTSAVQAGYERFHLRPFLVREVKAVGTPSRWVDIDVEIIMRLLHPSSDRKCRAFVLGVDMEEL
jgi:hypothetical protein